MKKKKGTIPLLLLCCVVFWLSGCENSAAPGPAIILPTDTSDVTPPGVDTISVTPLGDPVDGIYTEFSLTCRGQTRTFSGHGVDWSGIGIFEAELTRDGIPDIGVRLVSGKGTGLYQEELHLFDGADLTEVLCSTLVEQLTALVSSRLDGGVLTITADGQTVTIPQGKAQEAFEHAAYLGDFYWFCAEDGILYCEMLCGTGPAQFYGSVVFELAISDVGVICTGIDFHNSGDIAHLL